MKYRSTKAYGHDLGLSCVFRHPNATSHCRLLHGYSLAFRFTFGRHKLDKNNWVVDFGSLNLIELKLKNFFDHKTLVSKDDLELDWFYRAKELGLIDLIVVESVGAEAFAKIAYDLARESIPEQCFVVSVECSEHGSNSAIFISDSEVV